MSRLATTTRLDITVQARSKLYVIALGLAVFLGLLMRLLFPQEWLSVALPLFYFLGIGGTAYLFVGGILRSGDLCVVGHRGVVDVHDLDINLRGRRIRDAVVGPIGEAIGAEEVRIVRGIRHHRARRVNRCDLAERSPGCSL